MTFPQVYEITIDATLQLSPGPVSCLCEPAGPEKEDSPMNAEMAAALNASLVSFHQTNLAELQASQRRFADTVSFIDARALGGALAGSLLVSDNSEKFANLNAGVRTPTTLDHPNAVVGK